MRILWFTNDPLPAVLRRAGLACSGSGHWMTCLLAELKRVPGIQLAVATAAKGLPDHSFEEDGIAYYVIGQRRFQPFFGCDIKDVDKCVAIVREWNPDLIHIHGTERFFGLLPARGLISTPCISSIQGLLGPYLPGFFGALSLKDIWKSDRLIELATRRGLLWRYHDYAVGAKNEREILAHGKAFMGRTDWDRAHVNSVNPAAKYYYGGEILRPAFADHRWNVSRCDRHTVIFTNAGEPRRGTEVLLRAMVMVRREFPDAKLRLSGHIGSRRGYDRFLWKLIAANNLADAVEFLGYLDGDSMARELARAHVFSISSYVENSPNSLCEAMRVGMPCLATYVGGIPSLIDHDRTGLLLPVGDAPLLADAIKRVFRDDDLASELGRAAREAATYRHAPKRVVSQVLSAYDDIVSGSPNEHHLQSSHA